MRFCKILSISLLIWTNRFCPIDQPATFTNPLQAVFTITVDSRIFNINAYDFSITMSTVGTLYSFFVESVSNNDYLIKHTTTQRYLDGANGSNPTFVLTPSETSVFSYVRCSSGNKYALRNKSNSKLLSRNGTLLVLVAATAIATSQEVLVTRGDAFPVSNCRSAGYNAVCYRCDTGYILSGKNCVLGSCQVGQCSTCDADDKCKYCDTGKLSNTAKNCLCEGMTGCLTCTENWKCLTCKPGYRVDTGACVACGVPNCNVCPTASTCSQCSPDFVLRVGKCEVNICADDKCLVCASLDECGECVQGYNLFGGKCFNFDYIQGGLCSLCVAQGQCLRYSSTNPASRSIPLDDCPASDCSLCVNNHDCSVCVKTSDFQSKFCPQMPCNRPSVIRMDRRNYDVTYLENFDCWDPNCLACPTPGVCSDCKSGYRRLKNVCVLDSGDFSSIDCTDCVYCPRFDAVVGSSACAYTTCTVLFCANCADGDKCIECKVGFTKTQSGCQQEDVLTCQEGLFPNTGFCDFCSQKFENCNSCSSQECFSCSEPYSLEAGECISHDCTYEKCFSCNGTRCVQCLSGFELIEGECYQKALNFCSAENCETCSSNAACKKCYQGYVLFENKCFLECHLDNCQHCVDNKCLKCNEEFFNEDGRCVSKECSDKNCSICSSPHVCKECKSEFVSVEGICYYTECRKPCMLCDSKGQCYLFEAWYYDSNSPRKNCGIENCFECSTEGDCSICEFGFQLDQDGACSMSNFECNGTFYLSDGECLNCSFGCMECFYPNLCLSCHPNFLLIGSTCIQITSDKVPNISQLVTCTITDCFGNGRAISSQCENCQRYCNFSFSKVTNFSFRLETEDVTFFQKTIISSSRTITYSLKSIEIAFPQSSQGVRIFVLSSDSISTAYCKVQKNLIFSFFVGKFGDEDSEKMNKRKTIVMATITSLGLVSGFIPGFLSLLQMNIFFKVFYLVASDPSYILETANKSLTTVNNIDLEIDWKNDKFFEIKSIFSNNIVSYFMNPSEVKIAMVISFIILLGFVYLRVNSELRRIKQYRYSSMYEKKSYIKKGIELIKPVLFTTAVQILAQVQSVIIIGSFRRNFYHNSQVFFIVSMLLVLVKLFEMMIVDMKYLLKKEEISSEESFRFCSDLFSMVESISILLGISFVCSFQSYLSLIKSYFLISGIVKSGIFGYVSYRMKQNFTLLAFGSEIFFVFFILFNFFKRIYISANFSFEDLFYIITNCLQIAFVISNIVISRQFQKDKVLPKLKLRRI